MRNVEISIEKWPLKAPFYITGHHWTSADVF